MARQGEPFDELMIVNPISPQGEKYMRFYPVDPAALSGYIAETPEMMGYGEYPEVGYFADPPPGFVEGMGQMPAEMGYFAEAPEFAEAPAEMGYVYEAPETMGYYAQAPETMGYFAESPETMGYYAEAPETMGYFAESPELMGYGEVAPEMGYFAADPELAEATPEMGYVYEAPEQMSAAPGMGYFAQAPEFMGYGEASPEFGYFAEDPYAMQGYVRETDSGFNPRVVPLENVNGIQGYVRPRSINPTAEVLSPAEEVSKPSGQWFRPLW